MKISSLKPGVPYKLVLYKPTLQNNTVVLVAGCGEMCPIDRMVAVLEALIECHINNNILVVFDLC